MFQILYQEQVGGIFCLLLVFLSCLLGSHVIFMIWNQLKHQTWLDLGQRLAAYRHSTDLNVLLLNSSEGSYIILLLPLSSSSSTSLQSTQSLPSRQSL